MQEMYDKNQASESYWRHEAPPRDDGLGWQRWCHDGDDDGEGDGGRGDGRGRRWNSDGNGGHGDDVEMATAMEIAATMETAATMGVSCQTEKINLRKIDSEQKLLQAQHREDPGIAAG